MKTMTDAEYEILKHTLGVDKPNEKGEFYRNRFVTGKGSDDFDVCNELVLKGVFDVRRNVEAFGGDNIYWATDLGKDIATRKWLEAYQQGGWAV